MEIATLGAGCFWCVEAVYQDILGVDSVVSGYAGGHVENPVYQAVTTGRTGHAEVCQIKFNPDIISFEEMLEIFFETHDPTTLNRQGNDVGTQYRSVIFYHDLKQKEVAERVLKKYDASGKWKNPIVTEITPFEKFYRAEEYHQNYFKSNPNQGYCRMIISPKVEKVRKTFKLKL
ncbi:MAG: peptide-methionine (S)-S-oxide reductase MsrA [Candidatus Thorarchaeota archaeon]